MTTSRFALALTLACALPAPAFAEGPPALSAMAFGGPGPMSVAVSAGAPGFLSLGVGYRLADRWRLTGEIGSGLLLGLPVVSGTGALRLQHAMARLGENGRATVGLSIAGMWWRAPDPLETAGQMQAGWGAGPSLGLETIFPKADMAVGIEAGVLVGPWEEILGSRNTLMPHVAIRLSYFLGDD